MKFDQDLCLKLWYEFNSRVRCAFGNVFMNCLVGLYTTDIFSETACFPPHILHTRYINLYLERSRITFPAFRGAGSQRGTHYIQIHWLINYTVEDCNDIFWWPLDFLHTYCAPDISRDPASHSHASRRGGRRACCREANFSKSLAWVFFWCLFMIRIGLKNFKTLSLILHDWK